LEGKMVDHTHMHNKRNHITASAALAHHITPLTYKKKKKKRSQQQKGWLDGLQ
jgi:hypothetical protein